MSKVLIAIAVAVALLTVNALVVLVQELVEAPLYYEADLNDKYLVLVANVRIHEFHDYSYFYIALDSLDRGIYSYGFIILKDPDKSHPTIYLIHSPSNWTDIGLVTSSELELMLLIDKIENKAYYIALNAEGEVSLGEVGRVFGISIISDSVSKEIPKPKVSLEKVEVIGCNDTEVKDLFKRGEYFKISSVCGVKVKLPQETTTATSITLEQSSSPISASGSEEEPYGTLRWIIILLIIATTIASLAIYVKHSIMSKV